MSARADRIDHAVSAAGELISYLQEEGPVTSGQARLIVDAVVRAAVPNAQRWEVRASAERVYADTQLGLPLNGGSDAEMGA
jgi:hypothetical protein